MDWIEQVLHEKIIGSNVITFRLILSLLLSGIIGLEREYDRQPAGWRTHILISLGATLLMLLSIYIPQTYNEFQLGDPGRIAAQVLPGIGFLGAGAIFRFGVNVKGLTTAASIWVVAAIGLTIGAGLYLASIISTVIVLFTLVVLNKVKENFFPSTAFQHLELKFCTADVSVEQILLVLKNYNVVVETFSTTRIVNKNQSNFRLFINVPKKINSNLLFAELSKLNFLDEIYFGQKVKSNV